MGIMALFDALIAVAVYLIALRFYPEKGAWVCGVLSATAFSAAYFAITKYDAFPTLLLMGGILLVLYGSAGKGYAAIALGFLAKIYPLLALPPALVHAAAATSIRTEVVRAVKVGLPIVAILAIPTLLLDPSAYRTYLFAAGAGAGLYVNTPTNTLTLVLHDVLGLPVGSGIVSLAMYLCMAAGFVILLALTVTGKRGDPRRLLELVLLLLFTAVFFSRFHSPQYILWLTPFFALLLAGSVRSILLFYLVQVLVYIEFPLSFRVLWENLSYVAPPLTAGWYTALIFFILKWSVLAAAVYGAVRHDPSLAGDLRAIPARLRSLLSSGTTPV
jgi:hypothetical protein